MSKILFILSIFFPLGIFSQTNAYLKKGELMIGEQTELVYEFILPNHSKPSFQAHSKIIPCNKRNGVSMINSGEPAELEIIGEFKDTIIKQKNSKLWRGIYKITVWDTGFIIIPPQSIVFEDSTYQFNPLLLTSKMPKLVEGKDIYDIKETFVEIENDYFAVFKTYWWAFLLLLGIIILGIYLFKRKKREKVQAKKTLSLKDKTLLALAGLENAKLWEKNQLKEHYVELSFLFRSYLGARYQLNVLEKTSYETALLLNQLNLNKDTIETIKNVLDYADMVKFAKAKPSEFDVMKNMAQVRQIIAETSPIEIENVGIK